MTDKARLRSSEKARLRSSEKATLRSSEKATLPSSEKATLRSGEKATPRSSESTRPRTLSRVAAVQALFQSEQSAQSAETVIDQFVRHRFGDVAGHGGLEDGHVTEAQVPLFARIVRTAALQQDTLDAMLISALPESWPLARIDPVLRALMRAGACELWMADGPPAKVVINEYLDVAHGFFSGDEARLANGVLDKVAHLLRPSEFIATRTPTAN